MAVKETIGLIDWTIYVSLCWTGEEYISTPSLTQNYYNAIYISL